MQFYVTKKQLVNFILNDVNDKKRKRIVEAINTNPEIKRRYLLEKRKYDVRRYINDELNFGECCEIEEILKKDSRLKKDSGLYTYFKKNKGVFKDEQDATSNKQVTITKEQLVKMVLNDFNDKEIEEYKKISNAIRTNPEIKERYLNVKRRYDIDRYIDNKMDFGERCEIEEILSTSIRLFDYYELKKEEQYRLENPEPIYIERIQLINFILNEVDEEERKNIIEAINTSPETKERYLLEKRFYDVGRYIKNKMVFAERCEIEELIKKDSRLLTLFKVNNGVFKDEQGATSHKQITITKEQLISFILNEVDEEEYKRTRGAICSNPEIKKRYLNEKRKYDIERYIDNKMDFAERCEIEDILKTNIRLFEYYELKKEEIGNSMHISITKKQLVNFIFNNVTGEERKNITEAILTNRETRKRYLFEKRKYDVERYIYDEINIGERCEIEELLKTDSRLADHFKLKIKTIEEEQYVTASHKQVSISKEQLASFVLNEVNDEEYNKIIGAINTSPEIKKRYLFEKRKYDVERYINNELDFAERCEIIELIEADSRLADHFKLNIKFINKEEQGVNGITKERLVNFILNDVTEEESKKITGEINQNPETKERYLFEKRILDIDRYINDEMTIGECCEIEELIKMDSRLYDYLESNTEFNEEKVKEEEEQDATINANHLLIIKEQLVTFILNNEIESYIGEYEKISKLVNKNSTFKNLYLLEKRKYDIDRYLNNEVNFGERCEIEELLKINLAIYEYFELKKDQIEEQQNILINLMYPSVTRKQLVNFILNEVNEEERKKIIEAINKKPEIKERYLFEKRKIDIERYIDDEMTIGERCEIEKLIKADSRLLNFFELKKVDVEKETVTANHGQIDITKEQLVNFVLNNVSEEERGKISRAINTSELVKERYLYEKRKRDVERFIVDELDFGEACEIEELLKTDSGLFEYFEMHKEVNEFVLTNFIKQINKVHARIYNAIHNNDEPVKIEDEVNTGDSTPVIEFKFNVMKWVAAASIILMIGFVGRNIYLYKTSSLEDRLYSKYYEPLNNGDKYYYCNSTLLEAKKQYSDKEYELALVTLDEHPKFLTVDFERLLYQGLSLMELKKYEEAAEKLKQLQNINTYDRIITINNWYLGLCYLKIGENENAIEQLEKIEDINDNFYKESQELLKKLKK